MPYNGSGTFTVYTPGNPVVTGTTISSTAFNNTMTDFATGLTTAVTKDGQTTPTANLPMGGFKLTGLGNGSARTDSIALGQVQDGSFVYVGTVGGTADVITLTPSPAITAYASGQTFRFIASGSNTTNVTVNVSGLGAKAVTKNGTTALVANNIISGQTVEITYDGTEFQLGQVSFATSNNNFTGSVNTFDSGLSYWFPQNLMVTASVSGNALTVALKTKAGTDPTSTDPIIIPFRSSTLTSGAYTARKVTAATSMTVSNGSSLGILASSAGRVYIGAVDNSGTVELCVWTSVNYGFANPPDISQLKYFSESDLQTTTAEGGAGAADSSATLYSTTARASVPFRILGYIEITAGGSNAWSNSPTVIHTMGPFSPCTGKIVQRDETRANTSSTGTTVLPFDNTTPQNTEGDQYLSKAFTGTSGLNILEVDINVTVSSSVINNMTAALFKDANAGAFCARGVSAAAANNNVTISFLYTEQPATSSVTYKLRCGGNGAGTTTFNGNAGGGLFNGSMNSYMKFTEIFT